MPLPDGWQRRHSRGRAPFACAPLVHTVPNNACSALGPPGTRQTRQPAEKRIPCRAAMCGRSVPASLPSCVPCLPPWSPSSRVVWSPFSKHSTFREWPCRHVQLVARLALAYCTVPPLPARHGPCVSPVTTSTVSPLRLPCTLACPPGPPWKAAPAPAPPPLPGPLAVPPRPGPPSIAF